MKLAVLTVSLSILTTIFQEVDLG